MSGWGCMQNALIRIDSQSRTAIYTQEFFAVKHYTHYVTPESLILSNKSGDKDKLPIMVVKTPQNKLVVLAGNFNDEDRIISVKINDHYLSVLLPSNSLNTFVEK